MIMQKGIFFISYIDKCGIEAGNGLPDLSQENIAHIEFVIVNVFVKFYEFSIL